MRKAAFVILLWILVSGSFDIGFGQGTEEGPVADVFQVMESVDQLSAKDFWPGFDVRRIPIAIYDGLNTYLFNCASIPEGFTPHGKKPDVFVFPGQHPAVRGNSVVQLGDVSTATSVLSRTSRRTGEAYGLRDMAGIIIHEQFHVYMRAKFPDWRPNDSLLLVYPPETVDSLFLRQAEKEAFKRAVVAAEAQDAGGWAREALRYRDRRLGLIDPIFRWYENVLQLSEGLSEYVEKIARDLGPLHSSSITSGIAPSGVRDLGYVEGRWIALLLDRLKPDWKTALENGDFDSLEDVLRFAVDKFPSDIGFQDGEIRALKSEAESDYKTWDTEKKAQLERFYGEKGNRIEIRALSNPLSIRIFDPLDMETLWEGESFHRVLFSAAGEKGQLRIQDHPCIVGLREGRVVKVVITGLQQSPEIDEKESVFRVTSPSVVMEFHFTRIDVEGNTYLLEL